MAAIFVTGVGTDIGKTYVTAAVIRALRARGAAAQAFKPVLSGFGDPAASDAGVLLAALGQAVTMPAVEAISPFRYGAPLSPPLAAAREGRVLRFAEVADACRARMAQAGDRLLLIEGAGGVMSPLSDETTGLDLIAALGAPVLLVTGSYLGAISHTLTALEALRGRGQAIRAVVINESAEPGATLEETQGSVERLSGGAPVVTLSRDGAEVDALLRLL